MQVKTLAKYVLLFAVFGILMSSFRAPIAQLSYQLNKGYIAEVLCINKAKPELKCEGKCHLTKQIEQSHDEDNPLNKVQANEESVNWLVETNDRFILTPTESKITFTINEDYLAMGFFNRIERPPTC